MMISFDTIKQVSKTVRVTENKIFRYNNNNVKMILQGELMTIVLDVKNQKNNSGLLVKTPTTA